MKSRLYFLSLQGNFACLVWSEKIKYEWKPRLNCVWLNYYFPEGVVWLDFTKLRRRQAIAVVIVDFLE